MNRVHYSVVSSPVGELGLVAAPGGGLLRIDFLAQYQSIPHWTDRLAARDLDPVDKDSTLRPASRQLTEYFERRRETFDLELEPRGGEFDTAIWRLMLSIPYGSTWSYGELADRVGDPDAARAVGGAVGHNPLPIVIPCHRVIGADGSLVGYGGGLAVKEKLLILEGALLCPLPKIRRPRGSGP